MNAKKFSDAMSEIDNKYVEEAVMYGAAQKTKRPLFKRIMRGAIAACLCVALAVGIFFKTPVPENTASHIVTKPGFLTVAAYAASSGEEIVMQEGIELPLNYDWNPAMSSRPGLPLTLSAADYQDVIFEVSADGGELLLWEGGEIIPVSSPFKAENYTTIYWTALYQTDNGSVDLYTGNRAYINIMLYEGNNIVGYAVVEIRTEDAFDAAEQTYMYYAKLLESVSFPKVDGNYQQITDEYVESEIERIKSEISDTTSE